MRKLVYVSMLLLGCAWAADRPNLNGTWVLDSTHSQMNDAKLKSETLSISQKEDSVEISEASTETNGKGLKADIACNTDGKECKVKKNGQMIQISFWYNGPMLVMMELSHGGDYVTKTRLKPSDDGKTLNLEVIHLAPPGRKTENLAFVRQ